MISLLCSFFDNIINSIREIPTGTRVFIEIIMVALVVTCIIFAINISKKHDEKPIKWMFVVFAVILLILIFILGIIT